MKDPSLAIQGAVNAALRASAAVKALIGDPARVYDKVVAAPAYPFVRIGDDQALGDSTGCADGWEVLVTVHIFSNDAQAPRVEAKQISDAVVAALANDAALPAPDGFLITLSELVQARTFMEDDGLTAHGVAVIRYLVDDVA